MNRASSQYSPNPFNHGQCSVRFRCLATGESELLSRCLSEGWALDLMAAKGFVRKETYSKTFHVETQVGQYVFQMSNINTEAQQQINDLCSNFCLERGLPAPRKIRPNNGKSYFPFEDKFCSLYQYIQGRHFSGSRSELIQAAKCLARFHQVFKTFPYVQLIMDIKGEVYPFDIDQWNDIRKKIPLVNPSEFDILADKAIDAAMARIQFLESLTPNLPRCVGHFDWHPHNLIFDVDQNLIGILDFDLLRYSFRCADVALAMHKLSRVFGQHTEMKADIGATLNDRCQTFLEAYNSVTELSQAEVSALIGCLYDEARRKISYILSKFYLQNDSSSNFDLEKQLTQLYEIEELSLK